MPFFSVIIPTYNRANFLKNAIQSVLSQTFLDFELLIIDWCKTIFKGFRCSFSQGKDVIKDFSELVLCEHQIIANSTFSWWAAWLNPNKNKRVVAPSEWYLNHWSNDDLILPEWKVL